LMVSIAGLSGKRLAFRSVPGAQERWPSMIEAKGLTKKYGEKTAVDDLTFTVQPGIVTGFLGPNGAGESTTMRMISGSMPPPAAL